MAVAENSARICGILVKERGALSFLFSVFWICFLAIGVRLLGLDRIVFSETFGLAYFDKVGHVVLFGLLSFLIHFLARKKTSWTTLKVIVTSLLLVSFLGLMDEFSQMLFVNRHFEHLDLVANVVGAGIVGPWGCFAYHFSFQDYHRALRSGDGNGIARKGYEKWLSWRMRVCRGFDFIEGLVVPSISDSSQPIRVLLVEDEGPVVDRIEHLLRMLKGARGSLAVSCDSRGSLGGAIDYLSKSEVDLILLDLSLPDAQGTRVYDELLRKTRDIPIIVLSNVGCWHSMLRSDEGRLGNSIPKSMLTSENLFWTIFDVCSTSRVAGEGDKRFGYVERFGRIRPIECS